MRIFTSPMSWSLVLLSTLLLAISLSSSALVSAAPITPGFCGDCQTFASAIAPCGGTFTTKDIEITGTYVVPQAIAQCACTELMQKVLWTCARCEILAGFDTHADPPQKYQTQCMAWGITIDQYRAPYTGDIAPGTATELNRGPVPPAPPTTTGGNGGGNGGTTSTGTATSAGSKPTNPDGSAAGSESSGPNGTAIGISLAIIGIAAVAGGVAMVMMKRKRRRHEPLDLDGTYVNFDNQWEKPPRPQSPAMMPAAPMPSRGPAQAVHRPSPFEARPGGGGSVVGGYDPQYDQYEQYDQYGNQPNGAGGYDGYSHSNSGGYDQTYHQGSSQGYQHHEYGYEHAMPTSGTPLPPYHASKGSEGGQYL
ncbi:hypothetical protein BG011_001385 [Mortierella polycephala]|uniref:Transmembrane protein n=1 Tax=Mortierella polycephala TaxID=41804 RepID=A0A9P6Q5K8_9FUNG|nr:hypothetical protein BG011_001385 [Mortierella polycephala]